MFCTMCGKKLSDNAMFCGYCGTSVKMKQPVEMQIPQPVTLPMPPQISQPEPQLTQPQVSQSVTQPTQPQASQSVTQPTQPQASQSVTQPIQLQASRPAQNPQAQYVAYPSGTPVAGVTEVPKKKRGWIVAVVLVAVILVVGLTYLTYRAMVVYLRNAMDTAYREQYHEWNSYDNDTERPWDIPGFSQDEPENFDDAHDSEELFPSDEENDDVYAYDGAGIGYVGDIIHTYWFDFTVNDVMFCQTFQGYTASEGYQLIIMDLTIENTFAEEVPMFDTDFWVEWGEDNYDFDYTYPVSNSYDISTDFLPEHYYLPTDDIVTGLLMYEVPVGYSEYMLIFEEYYEDGDVGDWFGVYLYSDAGPNIHTL